jgi:hypothetical protein
VPFLRVLVLAFALAHASGLSDALEVACGDACAEQDCDDGCPPMCPTCQCAPCPTAVTVAATAFPARRPDPVPAPFLDIDRVPSIPDPGEILRVPISRLV